MFQRYVVLARFMQFGPLEMRGNHWEFRGASGGNGRAFGVWKRPPFDGERGPLLLSGRGYVFKHLQAAELELERCRAPGSSDIRPSLYAVTAWTTGGAVGSVLDQLYSNTSHGAERLQ